MVLNNSICFSTILFILPGDSANFVLKSPTNKSYKLPKYDDLVIISYNWYSVNLSGNDNKAIFKAFTLLI